MEIIKRSSTWFRPLYHDGREIGNIKIYDESGVLYESGDGWLEQHDGREYYQSHDIVTICLHEVLSKRKLDLTLGKPFIIKEPYAYQGSVYSLYIPACVVKFKMVEEFLKLETETERNYLTEYVLHLDCALDNDDGCYDQKLTVWSHHFRTEPTGRGARIESIITDLKETGVNISKYDIEKIMSKYELTPKTNTKN